MTSSNETNRVGEGRDGAGPAGDAPADDAPAGDAPAGDALADDAPARTLASRLLANPWLTLGAVAATIGTFLVGDLTTFVGRLVDEPARPRPSASSTTSPAIGPPVTGVPAPSSALAATPGDCLDSGGGVVPCTRAHAFEVISVGSATCTAAAAIEYLGGDPALDVIVRTPLTSSTPGSSMKCLLAAPSETESFEPARGALASTSSAQWRLCIDERSARVTLPCSMPHTGEFVGGNGVDAPDARACTRAVEAYLRVDFQRVSDQLAVAVVPTRDVADGAPRCLVRVLGNQLLTDTVRGLRSRALPVTAAD